MKHYKITIIIVMIFLLCGCDNNKEDEYVDEINKLNLEIAQLRDQLEQDKLMIQNNATEEKDNGNEKPDDNDLYDQAMIEEELKRSNYVLSLYSEELKRISNTKAVFVDSKVMNLVHPEVIRVGEQVAGLIITDISSNDYGYEYTIQFDGEFTVEITLDYDEMFEKFFGTTYELDAIPYVSQCTPSTTFLIEDPNKLLVYFNDSEKITATFNDYKLRRMNGKPLADVATIIAIE